MRFLIDLAIALGILAIGLRTWKRVGGFESEAAPYALALLVGGGSAVVYVLCCIR